jgi:antitoxin (DNA-binding transcriptional repressor) of toxin-antitoxin stability system
MLIKVQADHMGWMQVLEAAQRGEEVVLLRGETPVAKAVPFVAAKPKAFRFGILAEALKGPIPDFEPKTDEELNQFERERDERLAGDPARHGRVILDAARQRAPDEDGAGRQRRRAALAPKPHLSVRGEPEGSARKMARNEDG